MDSEMDIEFSPLEILDEKRAWLEILWSENAV